jgi:hypothetical protein
MRGHGRTKNGVASLAYDPRIHLFLKTDASPDSGPAMMI